MDKLCYHAIVRSMVLGNVYMQPLFSKKQALYFRQSTEDVDVRYFLMLANWQIVLFSLSGFMSRFLMWKLPESERTLIYTGLFLWFLGLIVLAIAPTDQTLYEVITMVCISTGGGMYYWATVDDIIYTTRKVHNHHLVLAMLGVFSTVYMYCTHWLYIDFADLSGGFVFVHPVLLLLAAPSTTLLAVSEYYYPYKISPEPKLAECAESTHSNSLLVHLAFLFLYGIYRHIPAITLYLGHNHTQSENESLLFYRTIGLVIGEVLYVLVYQLTFIPVVVSIALPIILHDWAYFAANFNLIVADVILYAICNGVLSVWAYNRMLVYWEELGRTRANLNYVILVMVSTLLPGDLLVNLFVYINTDVLNTIPSSTLLYVPLYLSIPMAILLALHWTLYVSLDL